MPSRRRTLTLAVFLFSLATVAIVRFSECGHQGDKKRDTDVAEIGSADDPARATRPAAQPEATVISSPAVPEVAPPPSESPSEAPPVPPACPAARPSSGSRCEWRSDAGVRCGYEDGPPSICECRPGRTAASSVWECLDVVEEPASVSCRPERPDDGAACGISGQVCIYPKSETSVCRCGAEKDGVWSCISYNAWRGEK